jgi:hypothetical protein
LGDSSLYLDAQLKSEETSRAHRETSTKMPLQEALPIVIVHTHYSTDTLQKIAFEE